MLNEELDLCQKILKRKDISITYNRIQVLQFFINQTQAVSKSTIEKLFTNINTVTIYRMLHTFLNHGIIHTTNNENGELLYALCKENCTQKNHIHNHIHFSCIQCKQTFCLNDILFPLIRLKKGYRIKHTEIHITGICDKCNNPDIQGIAQKK